MAEQPSSLPSSIPQGTPSAPPQTPPSFGAQLLGNKEYSVELNDAVMETQAWRNSRYNGQQLEAVEINKFTGGDKTYGKTPVIEKYSRNIYVANRVIGYDDSPTADNPNPGFEKKSYINFEGYYTINSDDTVSKVGVNFRDVNSRKGFERSFKEDFSVGSKASIVILDKGVEHNLKDRYTVDFNEGLLSRVLEYSASLNETSNKIGWRGRSVLDYNGELKQTIETGIIPSDLPTGAYVYLFKNAQSKYFTDVSGSGYVIRGSSHPLGSNMPNSLIDFFNKTITEANLDLASNKIFFEFKSPSDNSPYAFNTDSYGLNSVNVFELDINNRNETDLGVLQNITFRIKSKNNFSNPLAISSTENEGGGDITTTNHFQLIGSDNDINTPANRIVIYKLNPIPSILIDLIKEEDLPNGIGEEGFIVIPENFDPRLRPQINKILKDKLGFNIEGGFNKNDDTNPFGNRFFGFRGS